jgi:hypothetical protein
MEQNTKQEINNKNIVVRIYVSSFIQSVCFTIHLNIIKLLIFSNTTSTHVSQSLACVSNCSIWQVTSHKKITIYFIGMKRYITD